MSQVILSRQYIKDAQGRPMAVILPIEEYRLIEPILDRQGPDVARKLQEISRAASDPLFLADLEETMTAFEAVDAEWWERRG